MKIKAVNIKVMQLKLKFIFQAYYVINFLISCFQVGK